MSIILRRSASIASRRALSVALLTSDPLHPAISPELPSSAAGAGAGGAIRLFHASSAAKVAPLGIWNREIHFSAGPVGFRASDAALAEHAFARFDDEDKPSSAGKGADEGLEIAKLGISEEIVSQLAAKGIKKLFPIQRAVLEPAMQGRDLIGRAKTGTGKTLAFGIPIIDKIIRYNAQHGRGRNPLALILAPTRELARQVEKEFQESSRLDTLCVYGGVPVQQQIRTLNYGVDVVVGTPGRIIDLQNRGALNLSEVQFVVLDEADQMLAVGFDEDVEKILDKLPQQRQSMMFSATMPSWIRKLTQKYLKNPATVDLVGDDDQKLAEGITLYSIISDTYSKASILGPLIKDHAKGGKCIIFTQTKRDASRLAGALSQTFGCEPLHGDIPQGARERTLAGFRNGNFNVLIATDVAARGLDIPNVDLVIHYELPSTSELFVHRSGRTGRAGKKGNAILIYSQEQSRIVRGIEQDVGGRFTELPKITVEGGRIDMFGGRGSGGFDSYDGRRSSGRGGSGSFGGSSFSRPRSFGDGGSGRFNDGGSGRFGGTGFGGSSDAGPRRPGSFGDSGPGRFGSFGSSGQGSSNSFGGSFSNRKNSFSGTGGGDFGKKGSDFDWPGRSFSTLS